ncbi:GNAT family N-acetyltransferase [Actinoplanes sp. RD1]|uniref:GNAT family N-acetyltransferase n=1 Tax=Actinoplanes sp. RD1 TaxID=3064538 RepID=UPI0027403F68|nr:GNAT family N-acetyltransferase [Actinoplanes sp. RD1]
MPIELRPATADDVLALAALWHTGWHDGHAGHVPDELLPFRTPESFVPRTAGRIERATVAVRDGELAGFTVVDGEEVEQVYVAAAHRGTGVAATLLTDAEQQVAGAGHGTAWLAVAPGNTRARRFYERQGWSDGGGFTYVAEAGATTMEVPARRYVKSLGTPDGLRP